MDVQAPLVPKSRPVRDTEIRRLHLPPICAVALLAVLVSPFVFNNNNPQLFSERTDAETGGRCFNKPPHLGMIRFSRFLFFFPPFQKQLVRRRWPPHAKATPTRKDSGITLAPTHASSFKTINQNIICTLRTWTRCLDLHLSAVHGHVWLCTEVSQRFGCGSQV